VAKLFLFISNTLAVEYLSLSDDEADILDDLQSKLTVKKEPVSEVTDPWENELKSVVLERIRALESWESTSIRIAGHLRTCFGDLGDYGRYADQRFHDKERELQNELGCEIDIQIWGFHHEQEYSKLWKIVTTVIEIIKAKSEPQTIEFFTKLDEAFGQHFEKREIREKSTRNWDRLSVLRHEIVGLFGPLKMRLETARENRDPIRSHEILTNIKPLIEVKLTRARELVTECSAGLGDVELQDRLREISAQLSELPEISKLNTWLEKLMDALDSLRDSTIND